MHVLVKYEICYPKTKMISRFLCKIMLSCRAYWMFGIYTQRGKTEYMFKEAVFVIKIENDVDLDLLSMCRSETAMQIIYQCLEMKYKALKLCYDWKSCNTIYITYSNCLEVTISCWFLFFSQHATLNTINVMTIKHFSVQLYNSTPVNVLCC